MYKIIHKESNTNVYIGFQAEETDSDGEVYSAYYYILEDDKYPYTYDTYEEANNDLISACYGGEYDINDYEIVRV